MPSGLPLEVGSDEMLARFIMSSSHYNRSGVKGAAFLPNPKNNETSVFRHVDLREATLIRGAKKNAQDRKQRLHGMALVKTHTVLDANLGLQAQEPPPYHANIKGWPILKDDPASQKARQKERAALIAQASTFTSFQ